MDTSDSSAPVVEAPQDMELLEDIVRRLKAQELTYYEDHAKAKRKIVQAFISHKLHTMVKNALTNWNLDREAVFHRKREYMAMYPALAQEIDARTEDIQVPKKDEFLLWTVGDHVLHYRPADTIPEGLKPPGSDLTILPLNHSTATSTSSATLDEIHDNNGSGSGSGSVKLDTQVTQLPTPLLLQTKIPQDAQQMVTTPTASISSATDATRTDHKRPNSIVISSDEDDVSPTKKQKTCSTDIQSDQEKSLASGDLRMPIKTTSTEKERNNVTPSRITTPATPKGRASSHSNQSGPQHREVQTVTRRTVDKNQLWAFEYPEGSKQYFALKCNDCGLPASYSDPIRTDQARRHFSKKHGKDLTNDDIVYGQAKLIVTSYEKTQDNWATWVKANHEARLKEKAEDDEADAVKSKPKANGDAGSDTEPDETSTQPAATPIKPATTGVQPHPPSKATPSRPVTTPAKSSQQSPVATDNQSTASPAGATQDDEEGLMDQVRNAPSRGQKRTPLAAKNPESEYEASSAENSDDDYVD